MVFSSPLFLFMFLPVTLLLHGLVAPRFKNAALALCSLVFYAWGEPIGILVMLLSIGINYSLGMLLEKNENRTVRKLFLAAAVVSNLAILFYFKYFEFAVGTLNQWFSLGLPQKHVALPIGISFFTFQIMSYVVDVYRKEVNAQRSVIDLTMYISLFPQLIAGPIVRYIDVEKQIRERHVDFGGFSNGVLRFMKGFSKKILLADQMAPLADAAFSNIGSSLYLSWFGIVAYALQIYFDFSGYSDMAIGLGKMLGFEFAENFNFPYISRSVREFWRRWHISLSTWFRDYVYIPLGGNRKGSARTALNLLTVFFLTGLWHGAGFNFIVWGLYYGVFLILERTGLGKRIERWPASLGHVYVLAVVLLGWVFFRAESLELAMLYCRSLFTAAGRDWAGLVMHLEGKTLLFMIAGILCSRPWKRLKAAADSIRWISGGRDLLTLLIFMLAIIFLVGDGVSPFLYFRF